MGVKNQWPAYPSATPGSDWIIVKTLPVKCPHPLPGTPSFPTKKGRFRERGKGYGFSWTEHRLESGWQRVGREVASCTEYPYCCCMSVTHLMLPLSRDPILVVNCDMHEKSKMTNKYCFKMLSVWHQRGVCVCARARVWETNRVCVCVYSRCLCLSVSMWTCMHMCVRVCMCVFTGILNRHTD